MNRTGRFILLFYLFILFAPTIFAFFEEMEIPDFITNDYARITDVEYQAILVDEPDSNGKVVITEKLTYDIHAADIDNPFWELWRDLPESNVDGLPVRYKVKSVKQITEDGPVKYKESPKLYWDDYDFIDPSGTYGPGKWFHSPGPYDEYARNYECVLFYVNALYREKVVFEVEYEMYNATLKYNDSSELYLSMYSGETIKHLNSYKAEILIPDKDMPKKGNYEIHTYGTNSNSFPYSESKIDNPGYHTISFELDEEDLKFRPYNEYIELTLVAFGDDKHKFSEYANVNNYTYDDVLDEIRYEQKKYDEQPLIAKKKKTNILFICLGIGLLVIYTTYNKLRNIKKKYTFYKPEMDMLYFRDIPSDLDPLFAAKLAFIKDKKKTDEGAIYSAILLSLIRKKYVSLEKIIPDKEWIDSNIKIVIKYKKVFNQALFKEEMKERLKDKLNEVKTIEQPNIFDIPMKIFDKPKVQEPIKTEPFIQEENKLEPLTLNEEHYFNLITRHAKYDEITMTSFQSKIRNDYQNTNTFVNNIKKSFTQIGVNKNYFQRADYERPKTELKALSTLFMIFGFIVIIFFNLISSTTRMDYAFGGYTILGIIFIVCSILLRKDAKKYLLLTQYGETEQAKWKALYNYLNSETLMHEKEVIELPIWEKYLVYATAFGISEKVTKAIKIRCQEYQTSEMLNNNYYSSRSYYRSTGTSFRSSTSYATSTYHSSGYGGHGGYGGGGRGGGGGGGGH